MSAAVQTAGEAFHADAPKLLFDTTARANRGEWGATYDVAPRGDRFILLEPLQKLGSRPLHVLINWAATR